MKKRVLVLISFMSSTAFCANQTNVYLTNKTSGAIFVESRTSFTTATTMATVKAGESAQIITIPRNSHLASSVPHVGRSVGENEEPQLYVAKIYLPSFCLNAIPSVKAPENAIELATVSRNPGIGLHWTVDKVGQAESKLKNYFYSLRGNYQIIFDEPEADQRYLGKVFLEVPIYTCVVENKNQPSGNTTYSTKRSIKPEVANKYELGSKKLKVELQRKRSGFINTITSIWDLELIISE